MSEFTFTLYSWFIHDLLWKILNFFDNSIIVCSIGIQSSTPHSTRSNRIFKFQKIGFYQFVLYIDKNKANEAHFLSTKKLNSDKVNPVLPCAKTASFWSNTHVAIRSTMKTNSEMFSPFINNLSLGQCIFLISIPNELNSRFKG